MKLFKDNGFIHGSYPLACGNYSYITPSSSKFPFIKGYSKITMKIFGESIWGAKECYACGDSAYFTNYYYTTHSKHYFRTSIETDADGYGFRLCGVFDV